MMQPGEEWKKAWARVVDRAWADDGFKEKLVKEPLLVLKEEGLEFSAGAKLHVIEAKKEEVYLVIPPKPEKMGVGVEEVQDRLAAFFGKVYC